MGKKRRMYHRKSPRSGRRHRPTGLLKEGILRKNRRGYGFVLIEGEEADLFVSPRNMGEAMNGDRVLVEILEERAGTSRRHKGRANKETAKKRQGGGEPEGREERGPRCCVLKVLERASSEVVGRFEEVANFGYVVPLDKELREDIYVPPYESRGAKDGDLVLCRITAYPEREQGAEGKVCEIIAREGERLGDVKALLRQYAVPLDFSEEGRRQAEEITARGLREEDLSGRRDLRALPIVTIDGADSKDFDDGVSCSRTEEGHYLLGVHIADVSAYVPAGCPLDRDALSRGNSHYLLDLVVPMLPPALSDALCSLRPGEDRLCLSCFMEIDGEGEVLRHEICESVIRSRERLVYTDVSDLLEGCRDVERRHSLEKRYGEILPLLHCLRELYEILHTAAERRGALDFDSDEAHFTLDEAGTITGVEKAERRLANRLIEECMVTANRVVAEDFFRRKAPFLYRIHEVPEGEDMLRLDGFLRAFGLGFSGDASHVRPKEIQRVLKRAAGQSYGPAVHQLTLRAMQKARYEGECLGHFGLALPYYCHFTSPIRRYADLFIHRVIKACLHEERGAMGDFRGLLPEAAEACNAGEKKAVELEREVEKRKKAEYMQSRLGECFDGVISGVQSFGLYVALPNTVEGLVSVASMEDDRYVLEEGRFRLVGEYYKKAYTLGDPVRVQVIGAKPADGEVDFILI